MRTTNTVYASIQQFYAGENLIKWEDLCAEQKPTQIHVAASNWLMMNDPSEEDTPLCLFKRDKDDNIFCFVGAQSQIGAQSLNAELGAFLGSDIEPKSLIPISADELSLFANIFSPPVFKIEFHADAVGKKIISLLEQYRDVISRRPRTHTRAKKPFSVTRARFDRALLDLDRYEAESLLQELKDSGRLASENWLFLDIRFHAGLGDWREILDRQRLRSLTDFRLPPETVRDICEAIYRQCIAPHELSKNLSYLITVPLEEIGFGSLRNLFNERHGIQSAALLKIFILSEISREQPQWHYVKSLLNEIAPESLTAPFQEARELVEKNIEPSAFSVEENHLEQLANEAFLNKEYDKALSLFLISDITTRLSLEHTIACAHLSEDKASAELVLSYIRDHRNNEAFAALIDNRVSRSIEMLERQNSPLQPIDDHLPSEHQIIEDPIKQLNWLPWADAVRQGISADRARETLRNNVGAFSFNDLASEPNDVIAFADCLTNASEEALQIFQSHFAQILDSLSEVDEPKLYTEVYRALLSVLATSNEVSKNDLSIFVTLVSQVLSAGLSKEVYGDVIEHAELFFSEHGSISDLDLEIDLIETLVLMPCRDKEARLRYYFCFTEKLEAWSHRLDEYQRDLVRGFCDDFQATPPTWLQEHTAEEKSVDQENRSADPLAGQRIGIYTLTEGAAQRARDRILEASPSCDVILNSDHDCSSALKNLAQTADIFVFAWKSSKHQAYYCAKENRPADRQLIMARGKGSASIISAVLGHP
jgi:hypothetical protein